MNTIRELATLIFGLSKREKTDFEQYANRLGSDQRYMRVYRGIEKLILPLKNLSDIPEEDLLIKRLKPEAKGGNLTAYSNYLFKSILRSLRSSQDLSRQEDEILYAVHHAKILARRGMFDAAINSLETAGKDALHYEYHNLGIQVLKELVYLEGQRDSKSYAHKIRDRLLEINRLSDIQKTENQYFTLHHRAFLLTRSKLPVRQDSDDLEFESLKKDSLLADISQAKTFFSKVYFWNAHASLAHLENDMEAAFSASRQIIALWQEPAYSHLQQEHPRLFIVHLHNLVSYAFALRKFEEGEKMLELMAQFPCSNFDDEAEKFQNVLFSRQLLFANTGRIRDAISEVSSKTDDIEGRYRSKINTARLISLYYNTLAACFVLNDYAAAQEWSDRIYKIGKTEQRRDIQFINKVFQIIIRLELGQLHFIDHEIKNTTQNLRDHGQLDELNAIILSWLGKIVKNRLDNPTQAGARQKKDAALFLDFKQALLEQKAQLANRQVIGLAEILIWLESKTAE